MIKETYYACETLENIIGIAILAKFILRKRGTAPRDPRSELAAKMTW